MIWIKRIGLILVIIFLGTIIDYFTHQTSPYFSVAFSYFPHKILYGALWGFVGYVIFKKWLNTSFKLAFTISLVPAVLLQTMYYIQGHLMTWVVLLFLVGHFFMFLLPGYYICRKYRAIFIDPALPVTPPQI